MHTIQTRSEAALGNARSRGSATRAASLALVSLLAGTRAEAVPIDDVPIGGSHLNVETAEFVGAGDQTTYLVVDFRQAGGGTFAFGYRHEGMNSAADMLMALDADGVLDVFLEDFSFGPAVRGIDYPREKQGDVFAGAFDGPRSWVLWDGIYDGNRVEWDTSDVGINGVEFGNTEPSVFLLDGGFYGLSTVEDFPGPEPLLPLPGDSNSDGVVDGDDLLDALLGFGTTTGPTLAAGDADRDGDVDRTDIGIWQQNAGARVPASAAADAAPEPATIVLVLLALWSAATGRPLLFRDDWPQSIR